MRGAGREMTLSCNPQGRTELGPRGGTAVAKGNRRRTRRLPRLSFGQSHEGGRLETATLEFRRDASFPTPSAEIGATWPERQQRPRPRSG
jgi:hypothetical protein